MTRATRNLLNTGQKSTKNLRNLKNPRKYQKIHKNAINAKIGGIIVQVYSTTACPQALHVKYNWITNYGDYITLNQFVCAERNLVTSHLYHNRTTGARNSFSETKLKPRG